MKMVINEAGGRWRTRHYKGVRVMDEKSRIEL